MRGLTLKELTTLISIIGDKHSLIKGRNVKYVELSWDERTKTFWRVVMRPFGQEKEFMTADIQASEAPDNLFDRILEWLKESL